MVNRYKLLVTDLVKSSTLLGANMGKEHYPLFVSSATSSVNEELCYDWTGIEIATASYFRFAYVPLFGFLQPRPIFTTGLHSVLQEEFEMALQRESRAVYLLPRRQKVGVKPTILGPLDPAYEQTLEILSKQADSSATDLYGMHGKATGIGKTAWINRLNRLFEMGLISRSKAGKEYRYSSFT